jgi:hypothetical protein
MAPWNAKKPPPQGLANTITVIAVGDDRDQKGEQRKVEPKLTERERHSVT